MSDENIFAGLSEKEIGQKTTRIVYTEQGGRQLLEDTDRILRENGGEDRVRLLFVVYFTVFLEELHGRDYLGSLGIHKNEILPETLEEEARYRSLFLDEILNETGGPLSNYKNLEERNVRFAFRSIQDRNRVEKLIEKLDLLNSK